MAKKSSKEEVINHYGGILLRITGSASLKARLFSLSQVRSFTLLAIPIQAKSDVEPSRLANFTQQRAKLELRTTEINETFQISKIVVYVKPVAKNYPGVN